MRCNESSIASSAAAAASRSDSPRALYVHLPFCTIRCPYCDFATLPYRVQGETSYLAALERELELLELERAPLDSLFLGGGTPNALGSDALARLVGLLEKHFRFAPQAERSIEANPSLVSRAQAQHLRQLGFTRISLGAQSFAASTLRFLGRDHTAADIERAVDLLRAAGLVNVSLDLIFGVPGQTQADWRADLEHAIRLRPTHLSAYELTIESGTPLHQQWLWGRVRRTGDDETARHYALARRVLADRGYAQYEVSNFALAGYRCRHNERYWRNESYVGVGVSAASYVAGVRRTNHRSIRLYERDLASGLLPVAQVEQLAPRAAARETVVVGLRLIEGVPERRPHRSI
ncbi:MAG: radical SAM family heme chaperone HemW [Planctomycetota bacterium]